MRNETRAERYQRKALSARRYPISVATINFECEGNVAFLARGLACFGGDTVHVIGKMPARNELKRLSAGNSELVNWKQWSDPLSFIAGTRDHHIICAELTNNAVDIKDAVFSIDKPIILVMGHEHYGVPQDLIYRADQVVYIPMESMGFCLNTSQTGTILLYEYTRRMKEREK